MGKIIIIVGLLRFMVNFINNIQIYFVEIVNYGIERFVVDNINYFHIYFVCINTIVCDLVSSPTVKVVWYLCSIFGTANDISTLISLCPMSCF